MPTVQPAASASRSAPSTSFFGCRALATLTRYNERQRIIHLIRPAERQASWIGVTPERLICVGTSATIGDEENREDLLAYVSRISISPSTPMRSSARFGKASTNSSDPRSSAAPFLGAAIWPNGWTIPGMAPVVAVPTTSGTGSETGRASAITDTRGDHVKRIVFHPAMMPGRVILDPELTVGLPALLTAAVGMDALSHCLEAFSSPIFHPLAQGIALEGMRLVRDALPAAVAEGADLAARARMQVAATMGSTAFQKGLGAMHSLSHLCGAVLDTHHGLANAVVMPYVLAFNRPAIEDKMTALARYLDLPNPSFAAVLDWVLDLRERIGIPHTLKDIGVDEPHAPRLAPMAAADPSSPTNPIPLDASRLEALYHRAINGVL